MSSMAWKTIPPKKRLTKKRTACPLTFFVPGILHDGRFAKRGPSAVGRFRPLLASKLGNRKDCFNGSQLSNTTVYPEDPCMIYYLLLHFHTFTFIYHKNQPNEGKHTIDPMGYNKIVKFMNRLIDQAQTQKTPRFCPQMSGTRRGLRIGKVWNIWIPNIPTNINWVVVLYFKLHPYLGRWSNLTDIFQIGWNHQLVKDCRRSVGRWGLQILK